MDSSLNWLQYKYLSLNFAFCFVLLLFLLLCDKPGLLSLAVHGILIAVASLKLSGVCAS